ncbi:MAG: tRNA (adenosine(37)-N6)-threonylcarbamoyltransferase complex ATPase subunit type 1 TsaE [Candidatus Taylorbacteria bacterium RIFCSPLOWO2_01_FULL_44_26]|uniref:tRNA threonylcarbamoyladenosine biosynthesis protein TsaE n=2 Tax=Candidatus Tayloriibacteriota TaxID=1817919 RepID=A0A1G2MNT0_9BACT|nr:MAG: tRNA (adenosine(37)-N6)-threonylcarbamoyltransferase complex ATPase subunit type 1 TsaE [Candidatus Taylorbacteria bacterium RIFCSPHIGHO2_02_FULL_44_12]OHA31198.1 MAG: tRNA (adenosine(37)-N6)-threonylcarbamoyltransferase complex ATPase subunit type 1 TsaE [Candidatus Taylorbacteria bacterium RIFCSPLOWO2_01_FULL_44_26]
MNKYISHSLLKTSNIAREWLKEVSENLPRIESGAIVVGLSGDLGSGKTAFVKTVAKLLGVTEEVTSPTFVIMKTYEIQQEYFKRLVHIDAYRLEKDEKLEVLRFKDLIADPGNFIFLEWPERVETVMPDDAIKISFKFIDEGVREITFE